MKFTLLLTLLFAKSVFALETDQFHAASHVIADSSAPLNDYINDKFEKALLEARQKENISCQELADDVMTGIVGKFSISKISQFAKKSPLIERYPDLSVSSNAYIKQSIYDGAGFPFYYGIISRTINVGGVYIGTDKLGHFALVGRNYYRRYLDNLKENMSSELAQKESILKGFKQEIHILGYTLGGVLSFGDLEANYQGLQFAISMCEGENPYLIQEKGVWKRNPLRPFDIKNYINPKMDESFKPAFWKPRIWKRIKPNIKAVYCDLKENPLYQERIKGYEKRMVFNKNDQYIQEFFGSLPKFDRNLEDIDTLCTN